MLGVCVELRTYLVGLLSIASSGLILACNTSRARLGAQIRWVKGDRRDISATACGETPQAIFTRYVYFHKFSPAAVVEKALLGRGSRIEAADFKFD